MALNEGLQGRLALVTGVPGIGQAVSLALAAAGPKWPSTPATAWPPVKQRWRRLTPRSGTAMLVQGDCIWIWSNCEPVG